MIAVSGGVLFIGYQLIVYGWSQVRGANAGFFDILWPGRYSGPHPDTGTAKAAPVSNPSSIPSSPAATQLLKDKQTLAHGGSLIP